MSFIWQGVLAVGVAILALVGNWYLQRRSGARQDMGPLVAFTEDVDSVVTEGRTGSCSIRATLDRTRPLDNRLDLFLVRPQKPLAELLRSEREVLTAYRLALYRCLTEDLTEIQAALLRDNAANALLDVNKRLRDAAVAFRQTR